MSSRRVIRGINTEGARRATTAQEHQSAQQQRQSTGRGGRVDFRSACELKRANLIRLVIAAHQNSSDIGRASRRRRYTVTLIAIARRTKDRIAAIVAFRLLAKGPTVPYQLVGAVERLDRHSIHRVIDLQRRDHVDRLVEADQQIRSLRTLWRNGKTVLQA